MDNIKIFIDTDTEIPFIVEKILSAKTDKVAIIVPDRASLMTSVIGLKLIKRVVDKSRKLIVIVTLDQQGAILAQRAGLHVVSRVGEINEHTWESIQKDKFDFDKKNSRSYYVEPEVTYTPEPEPAVIDEEVHVQTESYEVVMPEIEQVHIEPLTITPIDLTNEVIETELVEDAAQEEITEDAHLISDIPVRSRKTMHSNVKNLTFLVGKDIAEKKKYLIR